MELKPRRRRRRQHDNTSPGCSVAVTPAIISNSNWPTCRRYLYRRQQWYLLLLYISIELAQEIAGQSIGHLWHLHVFICVLHGVFFQQGSPAFDFCRPLSPMTLLITHDQQIFRTLVNRFDLDGCWTIAQFTMIFSGKGTYLAERT